MVRIETAGKLSFQGTKISVDGKELNEVYSVTFRQVAGDVPRLMIESFAVDTVIEGAMKVEHIALCPSCRKEMQDHPREVVACDVTTMDDEVTRYVAGPKESAD